MTYIVFIENDETMADMNQLMDYMVEFKLPNTLDDAFMSKIPLQRMRINDLFTKKKINTYTLALDRSKVWATITAKEELEVIEIVESLPLTVSMEYKIIPLMFNELVKPGFPAISLN